MSNIYCPWEPAQYIIFSSNVPSLLYYALIPGMLTALLLGIFVLIKTNRSLVSFLLIIISILFSIWGIFALILWATNNPATVMSLWSLTVLVEPLIYAAALYLTIVFVEHKDISYKSKLLIFFLLLPLIIFVPTKYDLEGVIISQCDAIEGPVALYFSYFLEILFSLWIIIYSTKKYFQVKEREAKNRILLFTVGIVFFLLSFSSGNIIGSLTVDWNASIYGYFGLPVFLSFLSYLILKYQAFNIDVIAAQFLTVAVWIGVFSEFFIVQDRSNQIITGITLALVTYFGWTLFRSIKEEVKTSEQLTLMSRRLSGLNAKLEELDRAKSEFISIASHQLRTPLTSVKGFTSLILDNTFGKIPAAQKRAVEKVFVNNEKLCLLVEDMLNASRLEAGRLEYEFEEADLVDVAKSTVGILDLYAKSKKIKLIWEKPNFNQAKVIIDQRKVSEIISNLIDNAIKYTPKGSVTVSVEKFSRAQKVGKFANSATTNGKWVRVIVKDTGIGMTPKQVNGIFEKFQSGNQNENAKSKNQMSNETINSKKKDGSRLAGRDDNKDDKESSSSANGNTYAAGTGLGVYISRQMAQAMGGKLYAESAGKGKGSTFYLELPLVKK